MNNDSQRRHHQRRRHQKHRLLGDRGRRRPQQGRRRRVAEGGVAGVLAQPLAEVVVAANRQRQRGDGRGHHAARQAVRRSGRSRPAVGSAPGTAAGRWRRGRSSAPAAAMRLRWTWSTSMPPGSWPISAAKVPMLSARPRSVRLQPLWVSQTAMNGPKPGLNRGGEEVQAIQSEAAAHGDHRKEGQGAALDRPRRAARPFDPIKGFGGEGATQGLQPPQLPPLPQAPQSWVQGRSARVRMHAFA